MANDPPEDAKGLDDVEERRKAASGDAPTSPSVPRLAARLDDPGATVDSEGVETLRRAAVEPAPRRPAHAGQDAGLDSTTKHVAHTPRSGHAGEDAGLDPTVRRSSQPGGVAQVGQDVGFEPTVMRGAQPDAARDSTVRRSAKRAPPVQAAHAGQDVGLEPTALRAPADAGRDSTARRASKPGPPVPGASFPSAEPSALPLAHDVTTVRRITSDTDPLIGAMLGEYRVLAPLGEGGMGVVYRGEHPVIGRPVAIKLLRREYASDANHARRFLEEARSLSAARHPNIIDVFSFGETPAGDAYIVMELLEGEPLDQVLAERAPLSPKETLSLLIPMLNGLGAAHAAGVIHRDLKPANVFLERLHDGTIFPKLLDFGLARRGERNARQVRQTSVGGTPLYIAPEQARGEDVGPYTDLYSVGCIAYEMLTGKPPFTSANFHEVLDAHRSLAPKPLRSAQTPVPVELEKLVLRLLEKDPAKRPASALDVREQLERLSDVVNASAVPTRPVRAVPPAERRERTEESPAFIPSAEAVSRDTTDEHPSQGGSRWKLPVAVVSAVAVLSLVAWLALRTGEEVPRPPPPPLVKPVLEVRPEPPATPPEPVEVVEPTEKPTDKPTDKPPEPVAVTKPEPKPVKPPPTPKPPRHTSRDVNKKWRELHLRSKSLPEDLRRAAKLQLDEARYCSGAPDVCWGELVDIEKTFFAK